MKVSEICGIVSDCDRFREILLQGNRGLTCPEVKRICNLLWDYRNELMKKEVKG